MRSLIRALMAVLACFLTVPSTAQTVTGSLSGHVTDSSGAVVVKAKIAVVNEETGLVREITSDEAGYYFFNFLPLGAYRVTASLANFRTVEKKGVSIDLNHNTVSDFVLQPAAVTTEIVVTGEAPLINTTGSDVKSTMDSRLVSERPLQTRNFLMLAETVPGFQDNAVGGQNNPTASSGSSVQINGTGTRGTSFQIDGINNDDSSENQNRQGVNVSSIQEMQVLTNNFTAEFGRSYGAIVLVQTKQGTNNYHGEGFFYEINRPWGFANNYYANFNGTPIPKSRRHDFGGILGGPLKQNKLFFFTSYEGVRNGGGSTSTYSVLLPNERQPDPSVTDPKARAFIESIIARFPVVTPNSRNLCPAPQTITGPLDGKTYSVAQPCRVYTMGTHYSYPSEDGSERLDWNLSPRDTATGRFQYSQQQTGSTDWIKGQVAGQNNHQWNVGITETHIYSNRQTGEFRMGVGRRETQVDIVAGDATPIFRFGGTYGSIIGNAGNFPIHRYQTDYQYVYNHSWVATGKLTLKAGADFRPSQLNDFSDNYTRGYWSMGSYGWVQTAPGNNWVYEDGYYNFLRGDMTGGSYTQGYGPAKLGNRLKEVNFYVQADYRALPGLTLNLGGRDEYVRSPKEVQNLVNYGYGDTNGIEPRIGFAYSPNWQNGFLGKLTGGPGNMAVHGGFGMFHGRLFQSLFSQGGASIRFNPPNAALIGFPMTSATDIGDPTSGFVFQPGPPTARLSIAQVDPNLTLPYTEQWNLTFERKLPEAIGLSVGYVGNRGIGLPFYDVLNRAEFPFRAPTGMFANDPMKNFEGVMFDCIDPNLNNAKPISPKPGEQCISMAQTYANARRPDPRYSTIYRIRNGSWSYYNALQLVVTKRQTHGLSLQAAYTWSKALDTGSEATITGIDTNIPYLQNDTAASMKGYSLFDTPQRFTMNYAYEFPWMKTQKGFLGHALGGWTLSGTILVASGNPFTVFVGQDLNADGIANDRPNVLDPSIYGKSVDNGHYVPGTRTTYSQNQLPINDFFPNYTIATASFGAAFNPGINNKGNEYRNGFRSAGRNNFDASLNKSVRLTERTSLVLRWDVYNVFNFPQFGYPSETVTASTFGQISSQRDNRGYFTDGFGGARFMQIAARIVF